MFLKWLNFLGEKLNLAVVTDANGNISYNGATIPTGLHPDFIYQFWPDGSVEMRGGGTGIGATGQVFRCNNCFFKSTVLWGLIDSGQNASIEGYFIGSYIRSFIGSGTSDGSFTAPPFRVYQQIFSSGNVNIKTGGTYTSTL